MIDVLLPSFETAALLISIVFVAGFIQGLVGFGAGLTMIPIFILFVEPTILIPAALLNGLIMNGALALEARQHIQPRRIFSILIGAVLGLPFGTYLLVLLTSDILKVMIGAVIAVFGTLLLFGWRFHLKNERLLGLPIGVASGLLNGSVSMSGPPVILFFENQGVMRDHFRANLVCYFSVLNCLTLIAFGIIGLITLDVLVLAGWTLPLAVSGIYLGTKMSKKVDETTFRRIALILVSLAGLVSLTVGLTGILN